MSIWVFPKIGVPPNHEFVHRVFHEINHPFWGFYHPPIFGSTPRVLSGALMCDLGMSAIEDPWSLVRLGLGSLAGESWRVKQAKPWESWGGLKQRGDEMEGWCMMLK